MSNRNSRKQINVEVGQQIKKYREAAGLSREVFSEKIGIAPRCCASLENGVVGISLTTLRSVCEFFGVSADAILWTDHPSAREAAGQIEIMLAGVSPGMLPLIVDNIRGQVKLIELAHREGTQPPDQGREDG